MSPLLISNLRPKGESNPCVAVLQTAVLTTSPSSHLYSEAKSLYTAIPGNYLSSSQSGGKGNRTPKAVTPSSFQNCVLSQFGFPPNQGVSNGDPGTISLHWLYTDISIYSHYLSIYIQTGWKTSRISSWKYRPQSILVTDDVLSEIGGSNSCIQFGKLTPGPLGQFRISEHVYYYLLNGLVLDSYKF